MASSVSDTQSRMRVCPIFFQFHADTAFLVVILQHRRAFAPHSGVDIVKGIVHRRLNKLEKSLFGRNIFLRGDILYRHTKRFVRAPYFCTLRYALRWRHSICPPLKDKAAIAFCVRKQNRSLNCSGCSRSADVVSNRKMAVRQHSFAPFRAPTLHHLFACYYRDALTP